MVAALQLLNFHDCEPHPLTSRPIHQKILRGQKAHNRGPEPHVMTLDFPGRPESRITLVRLKDLYPAHLRESLFANLSSHQIYGPTKHVLDGILILSHGTIALVNPVDNSSSSVE
jgi:hypothetical protein